MSSLPEVSVELLHDVAGLSHHGILHMLKLVPRVLEVRLFEEEIPDEG